MGAKTIEEELAKHVGMVSALLECARFVLESTSKMALDSGHDVFASDIAAAQMAIEKACLKIEVAKGLQSHRYEAIRSGEMRIKESFPFGDA